MSTQNIMWTALPNGLTPDGTRLRLSVLVSPRLTADAATGTLAEFPDFQDWPAQVAGLTFSVEFTGGPTVSATPVVEPGNPALDSPAWKALFPATFPVRSYAFDDRSALASQQEQLRERTDRPAGIIESRPSVADFIVAHHAIAARLRRRRAEFWPGRWDSPAWD